MEELGCCPTVNTIPGEEKLSSFSLKYDYADTWDTFVQETISIPCIRGAKDTLICMFLLTCKFFLVLFFIDELRQLLITTHVLQR